MGKKKNNKSGNNNNRNQNRNTDNINNKKNNSGVNAVEEKKTQPAAEDVQETKAETEVMQAKAEEKKEAEDKRTEDKKPEDRKTEDKKAEDKKTENKKTVDKKTGDKKAENKAASIIKEEKDKITAGLKAKDAKTVAVSVAKILLPAAACIIVIAVIVSFMSSRKTSDDEQISADTNSTSESQEEEESSQKPLEANAYPEINALMDRFYTALAEGDMDTITAIRDETSDTEYLTLKKRSEFIEHYDNLICYTKEGLADNSYFVYVTYYVKFNDIETKSPGLTAFYVYPGSDGNYVIDGVMDKDVLAAFDLVTVQQDVVDLYNRIDVEFADARSADGELDKFMDNLYDEVKNSVEIEMAQLQEENEQQTQTDAGEGAQGEEAPEQGSTQQQEEIMENQTVNQIVRTTDTVNVRSSDSEEADKIGRLTTGTELTRIEERVNGWSKVIFEGNEAYIKSDYLEVVSTEAVDQAIRQVKATTNVNVRSAASQDSEKLGLAKAQATYDLLEDLGEWYRINYNGSNGYVKSEFFE